MRMSNIEATLQERAGHVCELCKSEQGLSVLAVSPKSGESASDCVYACDVCVSQYNGESDIDPDHWRCLNDSMWSQEPAVQVVAWRMLNRLSDASWAQGLLDMLYLDDELMAWAQDGAIGDADVSDVVHKDSNGAVLDAGDTVTLIKDLDVKGANFTAKRGTAVRGISLVADNPDHIEGRVNGQRIVILTKFVKKS